MAIQSTDERLANRLGDLERRFDAFISQDRPGSQLFTASYVPFGGANGALATDSALRWIDASNFLGIGSSIVPESALDVQNGTIRAKAGTNVPPTGGVGLELITTGGTSILQAFDRDGATFTPLAISASSIAIGHGSTIFSGGSTGLQRSSGTALFGIDATLAGSAIGIASSGVVTPFSNASVFSGLMIFNDPSSTGVTALLLVGGAGGITLVSATIANTITLVKDTASRINIYLESSIVKIQNNLGVTVNASVFAIRMRTTL